MTDSFYTPNRRMLAIANKDNYGFQIAELEETNGKIIHKYTQRYVIEYIKLRDEFIYKNIPTSVLQDMKSVIENELKERKINRNSGSDGR